MLSIHNTSKNTIIAQSGAIADTFLSRMIGLLSRKSLSADEALVITRCNSIHMLFMRFSIDVIFIDKHDCVVGLVEHIKPFRLSPIFFQSQYAIEVSEGVIRQTKTAIGDQIEVKEI